MLAFEDQFRGCRVLFLFMASFFSLEGFDGFAEALLFGEEFRRRLACCTGRSGGGGGSL